MYYRLFSKFYRKAAEKMCLECQPFIKKGAEILDLGCGSAIVGKTFEDFFQAKILGIDIVDKRIEKIPFQLYDGKNIPFPENSFDVVLINFVLHHTPDPNVLLKEAKRVSREKIIVFEDLPECPLEKLISFFHGKSFAIFFQNKKRWFSKTSFKSEREWERIFQKIGLKIIFKKRKETFPLKKELFVLTK